jgi:hypothetical protein
MKMRPALPPLWPDRAEKQALPEPEMISNRFKCARCASEAVFLFLF